MSIDKFHFVTKDTTTEITDLEAAEKMTPKAHSLYVQRAGIEHLYIFENEAHAAETFEHWRRQPCERIVLTLDGVPQAGERLPLKS